MQVWQETLLPVMRLTIEQSWNDERCLLKHTRHF